MDNMELFRAFRDTPIEARKTIQAGRLKGFTDINPMWRFKRLTEVFGPCGIGWKYEITSQRTIPGAAGEIAAFVDVNLYYKHDGEWSSPIPGIGGSTFVANESKGLRTSDEAFKMALTDAISVACKALGMSSDIYFEKDRTKYTTDPDPEVPRCGKCGAEVREARFKSGKVKSVAEILTYSTDTYGVPMCWTCLKEMMTDGTG